MLVRYVSGLALAAGVASLMVACGSSSGGAETSSAQGAGGASAAGSGGANSSGAGGTGGSGTGGSAGTGGSGTGGSAGTGGSGTGGAGGSSSGGGPIMHDPNDPVGVAPPPAMGAPGPDMNAKPNIQAVTYLYLGDTDRMKQPDTTNTSWQLYGFDVDGLHFTNTSPESLAKHCSPNANAKPKDVVLDGDHGIDNSFGKNIIPFIGGLVSNPSDTISQSITDGSFTLLLELAGYGGMPSYTGLDAQVFAAKGETDMSGTKIPPPAANGGVYDWSMYTWHPFYEVVTNPGADPSMLKSKVDFPMSYVTNGTWVSGSQSSLTLTLSIMGHDLTLTINKAQLETTFAADGKSSTNGNIGGVLDTEQLIMAIQSVAGSISTSLCSGSAFDSIKSQIEQASDMMKDGTQGNGMSDICNGISIGLGYDTTASGLGKNADMTPPGKDPCMGM